MIFKISFNTLGVVSSYYDFIYFLPIVHLNNIAVLYKELFIKIKIFFYCLRSLLEDQEYRLNIGTSVKKFII